MILLILFVIILCIFILVYSIEIKLEIINFLIIWPKLHNSVNKDGKVQLKIILFKMIKIAEIDLKNINVKNKIILKNMEQKFKTYKLNIEDIKLLRNIEYKIERLNLKMNLGIEDSAITALGIGMIYTIISNIINKKIRKSIDINYEINPIYKNKNMLEIRLDSIIVFNLQKTIRLIFFTIKGGKERNVRSSDRKSYAYSDE